MSTTTVPTVQVRIDYRPSGKRFAAYRSKMVNGLWEPHWHTMSVADADRALKMGTAHIGTIPDCRIEDYSRDV